MQSHKWDFVRFVNIVNRGKSGGNNRQAQTRRGDTLANESARADENAKKGWRLWGFSVRKFSALVSESDDAAQVFNNLVCERVGVCAALRV